METGTMEPVSGAVDPEPLGGLSTEPEPQEPEAAFEPGDPEAEDAVTGSHRQLNFDVGGEPPMDSVLTVMGPRTKVKGQFKKGQIIKIEQTIQVTEVGFRDTLDKESGQVVDCRRKHVGRVIGWRTTSY